MTMRDEREQRMLEEIERLREALRPFAHFGAMIRARPIGNAHKSEANAVYAIHTGTQWEAELTVGHFAQAARVLKL